MECSVRHLAPGLRIKTENKGFAGSEAQTAPALQREKGKSRLWVCASKRRTKGLRGTERKPRRRCSGKKENPGYGFAHQNGEQRVCGEPSANRAGAAAGKKENLGYGFAHQNGGQRVCGEPSANRAGAAAGKKKIPALGLRIKTENKGFAGSQAQTLPAGSAA